MKALEEVINMYDSNILWGDLSPQFRGYQLSNTGLVRSLKFPNKYRFGAYIEAKKDGIYQLSDNNNRPTRVSINDLDSIVKTTGGYRIPSQYVQNKNTRNPIMASKSNYIEKRDKIKSEKHSLNEKVSLHFNIIDE